jgi:superfamily I DNA/RNA helicase
LTESVDQITAEVVERIASEPREKARGSGGTNLWDRAKRFVDLRNRLQSSGGAATELLEKLFIPESWIEDSTDNETSKLDMGILRQKALEMIQDPVQEETDHAAGAILQRIARRLRYQIATREPFASKEEAATLQVATLWGAKGVTADHVYILGLCQEAIPGTRREEYPGSDAEHVEEQRRLFYVSITRPRRTLVLSRARKIGRGDAQRLNLGIGLN